MAATPSALARKKLPIGIQTFREILDCIDDSAMQVREVLKDLYSVIKDSDAHIRFALLTGVSKFSSQPQCGRV